MDRRRFMKSMGFAGAAAAAGCSRAPVSLEEWQDGAESWAPTVCQLCPSRCGLLARVVDGSVVKLEGNPLHPLNQGRMCATGHAALQSLYGADRIRGPRLRIGGKGSSRWKQASWEEALGAAADWLKKLRTEGRSHTLAVLDGSSSVLVERLWRRFLQAFGSPNYIRDDPAAASELSSYLLQGERQAPLYDLENASYILSFGADLLGQWSHGMQAQRAFGRLRQRGPAAQIKLVQVDSRFSLTAARCNQWIPIRPGTEGALALGLAYVLIREELFDQALLEGETFGFSDWKDAAGQTHPGFRTFVQQRYRPDDVSALTRVPVEVLIGVAKEFAAHRPAIAVIGQGATRHTNGLQNAMAIHALNALVGGVRQPGGMLLRGAIPIKDWETALKPTVAKGQPRIDGASGTLAHSPGGLMEHLERGTPYPLGALILHDCDLESLSPDPARFRAALARVPLVVTFSSFDDASAELADLVLPDSLFPEGWQFGDCWLGNGASVLGVSKPVAPPLRDTLPAADSLLRIAAKIGDEVAAALPFYDSEALLKFWAQGIFEARRGMLFADPFEAEQLRALESRGWWIPWSESYEEFWGQMLAKGGWWEPHTPPVPQRYSTPSGKFEFAPLRLQEVKSRGQPGEDEAWLPHYEPPRTVGDVQEYPLYLNLYRPAAMAGQDSGRPPWLLEHPEPHLKTGWGPWVEIHPRTARDLGLKDGDSVWVQSPRGKALLKARIFAAAMPEVVSIPLGFRPDEELRGLQAKEFDPHTGRAVDCLTRVRLQKA